MGGFLHTPSTMNHLFSYQYPITKGTSMSKAETQLTRKHMCLASMLTTRHNSETQLLKSEARVTSEVNRRVIYTLCLLILNKANQQGKNAPRSK